MKRIALAATLAALLAAPVLAQKPADKPAPAPAPAAAEQKAPAPEAKKVAAQKGSSKRNEDARHCLDLSPNAKIIKCAEAYL